MAERIFEGKTEKGHEVVFMVEPHLPLDPQAAFDAAVSLSVDSIDHTGRVRSGMQARSKELLEHAAYLERRANS